jgi:hypothetical protein
MLAIEMIDFAPLAAGTLFDLWQGAEDDVLDTNLLGDVGHKLSLFFLFDVCFGHNFVGKEIRDSKESINSLQRCFKRGLGGDVTCPEGDVVSMFEKGLRCGFVDVASQCTNLRSARWSVTYLVIGEIGKSPQHRSSLISCQSVLLSEMCSPVAPLTAIILLAIA